MATMDVQKARYLYLYSNKGGKRLKNPVFVFIRLLILEIVHETYVRRLSIISAEHPQLRKCASCSRWM